METIKLTAKVKKNQTTLNRCVKALTRHNHLSDLRNLADDRDDFKTLKKLDRMCQSSFDKYLDYLYELPKYEQVRIEKAFY
jgi:hypothetical protein